MKSISKEHIRIWRSPDSVPGYSTLIETDLTDETRNIDDAYSNDILKKISDHGFNGIWVHGLLRNIVKSNVFPEFGVNENIHIQCLNRLIRRAAKFGIKVYIYLQPPRGINAGSPFWKKHPDVKGRQHVNRLLCDGNRTDIYALCTSTQKVKTFLKESSKRLIEKCPDLGGLILITASEFPSHCYSKIMVYNSDGSKRNHDKVGCPRCEKSKPVDIVNDIIDLIRDGIREVNSKTHIIAWNWSWSFYEKDPSPSIIKRLPKDVSLMCDMERGGFKEIYGKVRSIDEYSLSYIGPSRRFNKSRRIAESLNINTIAKVQIGTTHELATVINLPLIDNLFYKVKNLKAANVHSFMGTWDFGSYFSINTLIFNELIQRNTLARKPIVLKSCAEKFLPGSHYPRLLSAWSLFSQAMNDYPFSITFVYQGPINFVLSYFHPPGNLRNNLGLGRSWLMDKRGDQAENSIYPYSKKEIISGLDSLAKKWKKAAAIYEDALRTCTSTLSKQEVHNAWTCYHIFKSTYHFYQLFFLRKAWKPSFQEKYRTIQMNELENCQSALYHLKEEKQLGIHIALGEPMFNVKLIQQKIKKIKQALKQ